jgi:hypothetical protein
VAAREPATEGSGGAGERSGGGVGQRGGAVRVRWAAAVRLREAAVWVREEAAARVRARGGGGCGLEWERKREEAGPARPDLRYDHTPTAWPSA